MGPLGLKNICLHSIGSGPPVVLLHCLGVDHHFWDFAINPLAKEFRVLTYDFPGHGETPVPASPYGIDQLSAQLANLLESSNVTKPHIVGISLGGLVAQHFAATHKNKINRLVLIDTTPRYSEERRGRWAERAAKARSTGVSSLLEELLPIWFTQEFLAKNPPAVRYVRDIFARTPGEGYALACEALRDADLRHLIRQINAPTLVICGKQDNINFIDSAHWLSENIPDAKLDWLEPARHASVLEQPDAFLHLLKIFLK